MSTPHPSRTSYAKVVMVPFATSNARATKAPDSTVSVSSMRTRSWLAFPQPARIWIPTQRATCLKVSPPRIPQPLPVLHRRLPLFLGVLERRRDRRVEPLLVVPQRLMPLRRQRADQDGRQGLHPTHP